MSELIVPSTSIEDMGSLLDELIFFTSWLEHMKILFTMLQNSLQQNINVRSELLYDKYDLMMLSCLSVLTAMDHLP